MSDLDGSTSYIIKTVENSPSGSKWAIGTEVNLVNRLQQRFPDKEIHLLAPDLCMCATMYRIAPQNLAWAMGNLVDGNVVNQIVVDGETKRYANITLERMRGSAYSKRRINHRVKIQMDCHRSFFSISVFICVHLWLYFAAGFSCFLYSHKSNKNKRKEFQ